MVSSPKSIQGLMPVPRSLSFIVVSVGALALFLFTACQLLVSYPVGITVQGPVLEVEHSGNSASASLKGNQTDDLFRKMEPLKDGHEDMIVKESTSVSAERDAAASLPALSRGRMVGNGTAADSVSSNSTETGQAYGSFSAGLNNDLRNALSESNGNNTEISNITTAVETPPSIASDIVQKVDSGSCDLYQGKWIYDPHGPVYTNNTCPFITQMQNCQGNGRSDKEYENWRWKPDQCELPRFDGRKFLELMRGKTIAFFGDSVARNQYESLLCLLRQVETPQNRGSRRQQKWFFRSTSTNLIRIWSSWLLHQSDGPLQSAPAGITKVHLDIPDGNLMESLPDLDVIVLSSGHWFAKQSAYVLNGTIVGGQLWWPREAGKMQINNIEAFGVSVDTIVTAMATLPNYKGLIIVRSYSPDHYEGGSWNTGGSCTGKVRPATELVKNEYTNAMHEKQVTGFDRAITKANNGAKLRLMDITDVFGYRHDGHPGPYRSLDPKKVTKRGLDGKPPPQDCLHWCMPGPIDTWNEFLLEIIRRESKGV